jgi:hypothetical protein
MCARFHLANGFRLLEWKNDMNSEMKIKIVLAVILIVATLLGLNALIAAVQKNDHGATHTSSVWQQELPLQAEKIWKA